MSITYNQSRPVRANSKYAETSWKVILSLLWFPSLSAKSPLKHARWRTVSVYLHCISHQQRLISHWMTWPARLHQRGPSSLEMFILDFRVQINIYGSYVVVVHPKNQLWLPLSLPLCRLFGPPPVVFFLSPPRLSCILGLRDKISLNGKLWKMIPHCHFSLVQPYGVAHTHTHAASY